MRGGKKVLAGCFFINKDNMQKLILTMQGKHNFWN